MSFGGYLTGPLFSSRDLVLPRGLKQRGWSLIVIDKNIDLLLRLADRHFIIEKGRVVWSGVSPELRGELQVLHSTSGFKDAAGDGGFCGKGGA